MEEEGRRRKKNEEEGRRRKKKEEEGRRREEMGLPTCCHSCHPVPERWYLYIMVTRVLLNHVITYKRDLYIITIAFNQFEYIYLQNYTERL